MANLGGTIKIEDLPEDNGGEFKPLPEGWYDVKITDADVKTTKSGTGKYIKLAYQIIGADYSGRLVFDMITIINDNEKAVEIGKRNLGSLMGAIGVNEVSDTDQLIGHDLQIKVKIKPAEGEYPEGNNVTSYKALESGKKPSTSESKKGEGSSDKPPWSN